MTGRHAVIGCGNWGKNLVRNFCQLLGPERVVCCDQSQEILSMLGREYSGLTLTTEIESVWKDETVTSVAIATPAISHYSMAKEALSIGKHVFVEKPLTTTTEEAMELCGIAERADRVLMVDHLLLFHPAFQELERRVAAGDLGDIYQLYSRRTNLGIVRTEENSLWSLGPHDLAVMINLVGESPVQVTAQGRAYLQPDKGIQDMVLVTLVFPNGPWAHLQLSWFDPTRAREFTVIGSRKSAVIDETSADKKLHVFDVGVEFSPNGGAPTIRNDGTEVIPISGNEPLTQACQHFLDSVDRGYALVSTGKTGTEVVRVLEAAQTSLDRSGEPVGILG